jgi:signal transduction histidine kinase
MPDPPATRLDGQMCEAAGQDEQLLSELAALFEACRTRAEPASLDALGQLVAERAAGLLAAPGVVLCQRQGPRSSSLAGAHGVTLRADGRFSPRGASLSEIMGSLDPVQLDGRSAVKALGLPVRRNRFAHAVCAAASTGGSSAVLLCALRKDDHPFGATERALAQAVAECVGSAVAGKAMRPEAVAYYQRLLAGAARGERLERELSDVRRQLASIRQIASELASGADSLQALQFVAERAVESAGGSGGAVFLRAGDDPSLEAGVALGDCSHLLGSRIGPADELYGRIGDADRPVLIRGLAAGNGWSDGVDRALVAVPMRRHGDLLGALVVGGKEIRFPLSEEGDMLTALGALGTVVVSNRRLLAAERQQRELAEALARAASVLNSTLHLDEVLDHILSQTERVVPGDAFNVMLIEGGTAHIVRRLGYQGRSPEDELVGISIPVADYPSLARMLQTGEPVVISDTRDNRHWVPEEGQEWLLSYVGAPVRVGDVTVGFLNADGTRPGQFGAEHAERLSTFAGHAAVAIENALLYSRLHEQNERLESRVRQRTAEVEAEYAQLEAILDSSSDGIVVVDGAGRVARTNRVAEEWLSRSLSPRDSAALREAIVEAAAPATDDPSGRVLELTGLDLHLRAAPVAGEQHGEGPAAVVALHDVTPLRALARMKSQFVSNVSHELRTPVTTIKLYTSLLRTASEERRGQYLDKLEEEVDRQACLIEDILQISRFDLGRIELNLGAADLGELAGGVLESFGPQAAGKRLRLELDRSDECPLALADADQIVRVVENLVANAIRHTEQGGNVRVSCGAREVHGRTWATVMVKDDGTGIPEDELPHLFERFFRGRETREMQAPGTGVGLALARAIVDLHGGRITVESRPGKGAAFTVWLPSLQPGEHVYRQERLDGW